MLNAEGIWVPLVTPFRQERIDVDALQRLANHLLCNGIKGLVIAGTTGEGCALDKNEQQLLLAATREVVGAHYPLVFGLSGSSTREVVDKVKRFKSDSLAGFLISPPAYVRPSQEGILLHFQAIAHATDLPIMLYNIPMRTGVNMSTGTIIELAKNPRFIAIKECGTQTEELVAQNKITVLSGNDETLFNDLQVGACGAISAAAHIRPDLFVAIYRAKKNGSLHQARFLFDALLPFIKLLFSESNPAPVKAALSMQGLIGDSLRLPMTSMSALGKAALQKELEVVMNLQLPFINARQLVN